MTPKVSVVLPVYNAGNFISLAIKSILSQTFKNFELIIIDDGSTDQSSNIIAQYQNQDPRIKVIANSKNLGMARSLNVGIRSAKGRYIARQDADDVSPPSRFSHQVKFLDANRSYGLVGTFVEEIDVSGNINKLVCLPLNSSTIQNLSLFQTCFAHGSTMMRKSVLKKAGLYSEEFLSKSGIEDFELWTRMVTITKTENLPKFLYKLRKNPKGISSTHQKEQVRLRAKLHKPALARFKKLKLPTNPVVSAIITTHNRPAYLKQALASVVGQTYKSLEIIVIDNSDNNSSTKIVHNFSDERIVYQKIVHKRLSVARNMGLKRAHGQFIAFLDDDDLWKPDKIATQVRKFNTSKYKNLGLVYSYHDWINPAGEVLGTNKINLTGKLFTKLLRGNKVCGSASSALISAKAIEKAGGFNESLPVVEDWQLWLRISAQFNIDRAPQSLTSIRKANNSLSSSSWMIPLYRFRILFTATKLAVLNPILRAPSIFLEIIKAYGFAIKELAKVNIIQGLF